MLKRVQTPEIQRDWFNQFTQSILSALNNQKEIIYLIEQTDNLSSSIFTGCTYFADIAKDSMEIFLEKHVGGPSAFIWINKEGKLVAINATWNFKENAYWTDEEALSLHKWQLDALFITSKSDGIVCKVNPIQRTFDIIIQGKLIADIAPDIACKLLSSYIFNKSSKNNDVAMQPAASARAYHEKF